MIVRNLNSELGIPIPRAVVLARLAEVTRFSSVRVESGLVVQFPIAELERELHEHLSDAVQAAPRVRRGRPPMNRG